MDAPSSRSSCLQRGEDAVTSGEASSSPHLAELRLQRLAEFFIRDHAAGLHIRQALANCLAEPFGISELIEIVGRQRHGSWLPISRDDYGPPARPYRSDYFRRARLETSNGHDVFAHLDGLHPDRFTDSILAPYTEPAIACASGSSASGPSAGSSPPGSSPRDGMARRSCLPPDARPSRFANVGCVSKASSPSWLRVSSSGSTEGPTTSSFSARAPTTSKPRWHRPRRSSLPRERSCACRTGSPRSVPPASSARVACWAR